MSDPAEIANRFADVFADACTPFTTAHFETSRSKFYDKLSGSFYCNRSKASPCSISSIDDIIQGLKRNKAASLDGLTAEHIIFSHPVTVDVITKLINFMIKIEYIPDAFGFSVTIPIPKDNSSKLQSASSNYRGITISPIISKIFELCILNIYRKFLNSDAQQFGFKKNVGTSHAIFSVCRVVNYFTENESTVSLCSVDLVQAFDRLNRYILFDKLLSSHCPIQFINIMECWLSKSFTVVKWNGILSTPKLLSSGVRQGGILSPVLFSVYLNDLLIKLKISNLGCFIKHICFSVFMYADDLLLLAVSLRDLQAMIDICEEEFLLLDMKVNFKKSHCMRVGRRYKENIVSPTVGKNKVNCCSELRYLGVTFVAGFSLRCDFHKAKAKFFGSLNSILGKLGKSPSEPLLLSLASSKCSPILCFGTEACNITNSQIANLAFVNNSIYVKIFHTFDKSIIDSCHFYMGYLLFHDLRRFNFYKNLYLYGTSPASIIFNLHCQGELHQLCAKYVIDVNMSDRNVKKAFWRVFQAGLV